MGPIKTRDIPVQSIMKSVSYDDFVLIPGNRPIHEHKIQRIMAAIQADDRTKDHHILVKDVTINGVKRKGIEFGQHRFKACERLGLPIYYAYADREYTTAGRADVESIPTGWGVDDYILSYINAGSAQYIALRTFLQQQGMWLAGNNKAVNASAAATYLKLLHKVSPNLSDRPNTDVRFHNYAEYLKSGEFKMEKYDRGLAAKIAECFAALTEKASDAKPDKPGTGASRTMVCLAGYVYQAMDQRLTANQALDRLLKKLKLVGSKVCKTKEELIGLIDSAVNKSLKSKSERLWLTTP